MKHKFLFFLSFLLCSALASAQNPAAPPIATSQLTLPVYTVNIAPATQANTAIVGNPGPQTIYYWMVTNFTVGPSSPVGPFTVSSAPNSLSGSNYVQVTPIYPAGIANIDLLKTSTSTPPSGGCNCAVATGVTSGTINDQSNATSSYTVAPVNVNSLNVTLTNEVVGSGEAHPILRQNGVFVIDLFNIVPVGGAVTSVELDGTANQIQINGSTSPCISICTWAASLPAALILPSGTTATTQTAGDASAAPATDAFVQTAVSAISPTPAYSGNQLISGGGVEWTGGLNFTIGAANYTIAGNQYSSPLTTETLATADPSHPRLDLIGVNSSGAVFVLTGTPAANPAVPSIDPTSQLSLTIILVPAASTTPAVTSANIYQENAQSPTEWNTSSLGAPINLASTNNPYAGSVDIEATAATTGNYAQMTCPSCTVQLQTYNNLIFYLRSKATWPANRSISVQWFNGSTPQGTAVVIRPTGTFGFTSSTTTAYQQIAIPTSLFGLNGISVPSVRFTVSGTGATIGWYVDDVTLQGGQNGNPTGTFLSWAGTWNSTTGYNPNQVVFYNFTAWVALVANTASTPSLSNANWAIMTSAGTNQQVLFNDGGFFNGDAGLLYNKATHALTLSGAMSASQYTSTAAGAFTLTGTEGTAPSGVASSDILWADSTAHRYKMNNNNGGAFNIPGIASAGTSGHCLSLAANGIDVQDAGAACGTGSGTITGVTAGTGLNGGGSSGTVTVNLNTALPNGETATTQAPGDNTADVATDAFVQTALQGVNPAVAVQAATTAAADTSGFTYNNGVAGVGATLTGPTANIAVTIDGFTFTALGQRLLVKNDTQSPSGAFNGIYYVTTLQGIAIKPILTRALDFDSSSDINNTGAIPVINGTVNGTTQWVVTSAVNTVGTDPVTFAQFSSNPANAPTKSAIQNQSYIYASGGGTANAQTVTLSPAVGSLATGQYACWLPTAANSTTTPTLAVNGLAAKTIVKANGVALVANDLVTTQIACAIYDGTNYELQNPATGGGGGAATAVVQHPFYCRNPQSSSNQGNSFPTVTGLSNGLDWEHWEYINGSTGTIYCSVVIPHNVDATPAATIIARFAATTTATANVVVQEGDFTVAATGSYNGSFTTTASQTVAIGSQWANFRVTFTPNASVSADQVLFIEITRLGANGSDTYGANLALDGVNLQITEDF